MAADKYPKCAVCGKPLGNVVIDGLGVTAEAHDKDDCLDHLRRQLAASQEENKKLRDIVDKQALAIDSAIPFVEVNAVQTEPGHTCGPEGNCDCICVAAAHDAELLLKLRQATAAARTEVSP